MLMCVREASLGETIDLGSGMAPVISVHDKRADARAGEASLDGQLLSLSPTKVCCCICSPPIMNDKAINVSVAVLAIRNHPAGY